MACAYVKHLEAADVAGAKFLVLDVQDEKLVRYYCDAYGFVPSTRASGTSVQMYRPTAAIRAEVSAILGSV